MKYKGTGGGNDTGRSPLAMAEWIEIFKGNQTGGKAGSPLAMAEWIEIMQIESTICQISSLR